LEDPVVRRRDRSHVAPVSLCLSVNVRKALWLHLGVNPEALAPLDRLTSAA
jgi:hypothetical protein